MPDEPPIDAQPGPEGVVPDAVGVTAEHDGDAPREKVEGWDYSDEDDSAAGWDEPGYDEPESEWGEAETDEDERDDALAARTRAGVSPRRIFVAIAIVLTLILAGLVVYLLWFLGRPPVLTETDPVAAIQPVWEVYGPSEGNRPLFDRPMGIAVASGNRIYVTDAGNNRVCVFDSQGRFLSEFGTFGVAKPAAGATTTYVPGALNFPVGIDVDAAGNVYVASLYNDSIEVFDAEGVPLRRFPDPLQVVGRGGSGAGGTGIAVTDVAIAGDRLYATDTYQVVVFTLEGELVGQWGRPGTDAASLDHPNGIAVGDDGTVYVSDSNHSRVTAFTPDGEVIWQVGEIVEGLSDTDERAIDIPRGLTVMSDGSVLVVDAFAFELVRISPDGEVLERYGVRGVQPGELNFPNDVDTLRGFVVLADKENDRIQMCRLVD